MRVFVFLFLVPDHCTSRNKVSSVISTRQCSGTVRSLRSETYAVQQVNSRTSGAQCLLNLRERHVRIT